MLSEEFQLFDMQRLPNMHDVVDVAKDFSITEISTIFGVICWAVLLIVPLTGIDRRDEVTGATYLFFVITGAIVLTMAVPGKFASIGDTPWHLAAIAAFGSIGAIRWTRNSTPANKPTSTTTEEKKA